MVPTILVQLKTELETAEFPNGQFLKWIILISTFLAVRMERVVTCLLDHNYCSSDHNGYEKFMDPNDPQDFNTVESTIEGENGINKGSVQYFPSLCLLDHDYCNLKTQQEKSVTIQEEWNLIDCPQELKTIVGPKGEKCVVYDLDDSNFDGTKRKNLLTKGVIWKDIGNFKLKKEEFAHMCPNGDKLEKYNSIMKNKLEDIVYFCPLAFNGVYYNKTRNSFTIRAYCCHPICRSFQIIVAASIDSQGEHQVNVAVSDLIARHLNQKITTPVTKEERVKIKEVLKWKTAYQYRQESIKKADVTLLEAGNLQNIKSLSTLRNMRHEINTVNDLDHDDFMALHLLFRENYKEEDTRFIQSIETPLKVILNSRSQMELLKTLYRRNKSGLTLYLDATGSLIKRPAGVDGQILFYTGVVKVVKNHFPILLYISSQHSQNCIAKWLLSSIEFSNLYGINLRNAVIRVVTDFSPALMNAVLQAFNNQNMVEYLEACHCVIEGTSNGNNTSHVFLQLCVAHFMHSLAKNVKKITGHKKKFKIVRNAVMKSFGCLVHMKELQDMKKLFGYLCVVLDSEYQNELVTNALHQIDIFAHNFKVRDAWEEHEPEESNDNNDIPECKENAPIYQQSRMYKLFLSVRTENKKIVEDFMQSRTELTINDCHSKELLEYLLKRCMTYVSLWTLLIHPNRESNAPVESWFKLLKNYIVNKLNDKIQRTIEAIHEYIKAQFLTISNAIPIDKCCYRKKRKHADTEDKFMNKDETWGKRHNKRNSSWFPELGIGSNTPVINFGDLEAANLYSQKTFDAVFEEEDPVGRGEKYIPNPETPLAAVITKPQLPEPAEPYVPNENREPHNKLGPAKLEDDQQNSQCADNGEKYIPNPETPLAAVITKPQLPEPAEPYVPNENREPHNKLGPAKLEDDQQNSQCADNGTKVATDPVALPNEQTCDEPELHLDTPAKQNFARSARVKEENASQHLEPEQQFHHQYIFRDAVVQPLVIHPKSKLVLDQNYYVEIARSYTICTYDEKQIFALYTNGKIKIDNFNCLNVNSKSKDNYLTDIIIDTIVSLFFIERFGTVDITYCYIPCVLSTNALNNKMPKVYRIFREKLPNAEFLIMPYNYKNEMEHWCLVFVDLRKHSFLFFNPLCVSLFINESERMLANFMLLWNKVSMYSKYEHVKKWNIVKTLHAKQKDGYNCGIFILRQIYRILNSRNPFHYEEFDGDCYRRELQTLLLANSFDMTNICMFCDEEDEAGKSEMCDWVQCNLCKRWSHQSCVANKKKLNFKQVSTYYCMLCIHWIRHNNINS